MKTRSRRWWGLTIIRTSVCLGALAFLVGTVDWHDHVVLKDAAGGRLRLLNETGDELKVLRDGQAHTISRDEAVAIEYGLVSVVQRTRPDLAALAILLFVPVPFLQSLRFVWMLAVQAVRLTFWNSIKLSFAGNFFNFALPGTTGGDLIKAYYLTRFTTQKTEAVTTVFLDRAVGLLGLLLLAGTMILIAWDSQQFGKLALVLGLICLALAVGAIVVFSRRVRHAFGLPDLARRLPMGDQVLRIGRATIAMRQHKVLVLLSLANTIVLQFICMVSAWVMALALGLEGGFVHYLIYVPIGFLIAAIPITPPQAVGVLEAFYVVAFAHIGANTESQAVAFAVAVRVIQLVWALPGVFVPLVGAHLPSAADLAALETPATLDVASSVRDGAATAVTPAGPGS